MSFISQVLPVKSCHGPGQGALWTPCIEPISPSSLPTRAADRRCTAKRGARHRKQEARQHHRRRFNIKASDWRGISHVVMNDLVLLVLQWCVLSCYICFILFCLYFPVKFVFVLFFFLWICCQAFSISKGPTSYWHCKIAQVINVVVCGISLRIHKYLKCYFPPRYLTSSFFKVLYRSEKN